MLIIKQYKTLVLNLIFVVIFPFIASIWAWDKNFLIFPYVLIWSALELCVDNLVYRPKRFKYLTAPLTTIAFNFTILFGASLILHHCQPLFGVSRDSAFIIIVFIIGIYTNVISKLEDLIDYPIYR